MAHKVGRATKKMKGWEGALALAGGGLGLLATEGGRNLMGSVGETAGDMWDTYTGKLDDPGKVGWDQQSYNQDWNTQGQNYDANTLGSAQGYTAQGYDATQGTATMGSYTGPGQDFTDVMGQTKGAAQSFMDPSSKWYSNQMANISETLGQQAGQSQSQQNMMLAQRGVGGGGLRDILGSQAQATAGAATRGAMTDLGTQGASLGLKALGQAGQMATSQESNMLSQALANQSATNTMGLANMSATNQANQFTAGAQNTAGQWNAGQNNAFSLSNQNALNQAGQFNAQQNQLANQFNVGNQMNWQSWNASQGFAADQFNMSQQNAVDMANTQGQASAWQGAASTATTAKMAFMCLPEGTKIDTPDGRTKVEDLRAGDIVNGYGSKPATIMQKHEYKENPESKRFLKIFFDDGDTIDCCDMHKIKDVRAQEYNVGNILNGKQIVNIKWYDGVKRSYDLLTDDPGYRISGIPVNSMVEEMMSLVKLIKETI